MERKREMKRIISLLLTLCLVITFVPVTWQTAWADSEGSAETIEDYLNNSDLAEAVPVPDSKVVRSGEAVTGEEAGDTAEEEIVDSGNIGDNLTWTLGANGTLTISGTGSTWYDPYQEVRKWKEKATRLVIEEGLTKIDEYAFAGLDNLTEVVLPETLTYIGCGAFSDDYQIELIEFPSGLEFIGESAFIGCTGLREVVFYGDAPEIRDFAFQGDTLTAYYDDENDTWFENSGTELDPRQQYGGRICWAVYYADPAIPERMAGANRQETAVAISSAGFRNGADNVVIASGNNYPDALAGGPLAYLLGAPILLVSKNQLDASTIAEIQRLGAKHAYILGGTGAVGENVSDEVRGLGLTVERISGSTRFETATAVAKKIDELRGGKPSLAFFVYANNYPDALAISNIAALTASPILYIEGNGNLRDTTKQYMDSCGSIDFSVIIGGPALISTNAENALSRYGGVDRIYGSDRYETCIRIDATFRNILTGNSICLACGTNYPDALSGSVLAADLRAPLVLVRGNRLTALQEEYLDWIVPENVFAFGGTGVLSDEIISNVKYHSLYRN